jgi:hypothetical protein
MAGRELQWVTRPIQRENAIMAMNGSGAFIMTDMQTLFRTIDELTPEEKQQIVAYIQGQEDESLPHQPRVPGLFPGIWMSSDFDDELSVS